MPSNRRPHPALNSVSPQNSGAVADVGDVPECMSGNRHHVEYEPEVSSVASSPSSSACTSQGIFSRAGPKTACPVPGGQCPDSADVIGVMVRDEDRASLSPCCSQGSFDGAVVTRIHYDRGRRIRRRADQPDVVIRKRPHRAHLQHSQGIPRHQRPMSPSARIRAVHAGNFHNMSHVFSTWTSHLPLSFHA